MRSLKHALVGVVVTLVMLAIGILFVSYSGAYNVAATEPHTAPSYWLFTNTMEHSVRVRAAGIKAPTSFTTEQSNAGFDLYNQRCVLCHGAPGIQLEASGDLDPDPPPLWTDVRHWTDGELFWIIKNGVKMTGMPAFSRIYKDEDIWSVVAFLRVMDRLTPQAYTDRVKSAHPSISDSILQPAGKIQ